MFDGRLENETMRLELRMSKVPGQISVLVVDFMRVHALEDVFPLSKERVASHVVLGAGGTFAQAGGKIIGFVDPESAKRSFFPLRVALRAGRTDFVLGDALGFTGFCEARVSVTNIREALLFTDLFLIRERL